MRRKKIIIAVFSAVIVIIGIGSVAMYKIGDRVFDEMIDQQIAALELAIDSQENNLTPAEQSSAGQNTDTASKDGEQTIIGGTTASNTNTDNKSETASGDKKSSTSAAPSTTTGQASPDSNNTGAGAPAPTVPTITPTPSTSTAPTPTPGTQITKEKLEEVKGSATVVDKMAMAALVMKNLTQEDINELTALSAGGITAEEKVRMKEILYSRFTAAEITEIKDLYGKYMSK